MNNRRDKGRYLSWHNDIQGALVFTPIEEWDTDDVWEYIINVPNPWGGNNNELITMYRNAQAGECPTVIDKSTPSCGGGRFGCWTCTVVEKDRSLQGFVDSGNLQYAPLIDFRDWLKEIRNDQTLRQSRRRSGKITVANGRLVPGPFTVAARQMILERLQATEKAYGARLISDAEIEAIHRAWAEDLIQQNQREYISE